VTKDGSENLSGWIPRATHEIEKLVGSGCGDGDSRIFPPADPGGPQRNPAGRRAVLFWRLCVLTAPHLAPGRPHLRMVERHRLESANHTIVRATSAWTLGVFHRGVRGWLAFGGRAGEAALVVVTAAVTLGSGPAQGADRRETAVRIASGFSSP